MRDEIAEVKEHHVLPVWDDDGHLAIFLSFTCFGIEDTPLPVILDVDQAMQLAHQLLGVSIYNECQHVDEQT